MGSSKLTVNRIGLTETVFTGILYTEIYMELKIAHAQNFAECERRRPPPTHIQQSSVQNNPMKTDSVN